MGILELLFLWFLFFQLCCFADNEFKPQICIVLFFKINFMEFVLLFSLCLQKPMAYNLSRLDLSKRKKNNLSRLYCFLEVQLNCLCIYTCS